jgi:hypothetical protein
VGPLLLVCRSCSLGLHCECLDRPYGDTMKQMEYTEGPEALENFKRLATAILQAPVKKQKRQTKKR